MKVLLGKEEYPIKEVSINDYYFFQENNNIPDIELIERMTNCPMELLKQVPFHQIKFISTIIKTEINKENLHPLNLCIEFNGKMYGLIKPTEITFEEWINLEVFFSESPLDLKRLITHLYRPLLNDKVGEDRELIPYNLGECNSRQNEFGDFPLQHALSAVFFFNQFVQEYIKIILSSTETKMTEKNKKKEKTKPLIIRKK